MCVSAKWCQNKEGFRHFFGQQHKKQTAETSTADDEGEPENDQSSELKLKLPKQNLQQLELAREVQMAEVWFTKDYVLFALPKIKSQDNLKKIN